MNRLSRPVRLLAATLLLALAPSAVRADLAVKTGGLLFGDVYHVASHHLDSGDGASGLVLRRGYLTFNATFSEDWYGRLRFEVNQSGEFETYTFDNQVKDLYLGRKFGRHRVLLGLSPTPTFDLVESEWGMRYLARTPLDLQGLPSRDTGLSLQGPLNDSETVAYRAMLGSAVEFGGDGNDATRWMGALTWRPSANWVLDFYGDYEPRPGPSDRRTLQAFLAYHGETTRWGVLYSNQDREDDPPLELASAYLVHRFGEKLSAVARVDHLFEPSPKGNGISYLPMDPTARASMAFAGLEFRLKPRIFLTPNIVYTHYGRNVEANRPEPDLYLRLTLFLNFE
jgi:hypothetical protein